MAIETKEQLCEHVRVTLEARFRGLGFGVEYCTFKDFDEYWGDRLDQAMAPVLHELRKTLPDMSYAERVAIAHGRVYPAIEQEFEESYADYDIPPKNPQDEYAFTSPNDFLSIRWIDGPCRVEVEACNPQRDVTFDATGRRFSKEGVALALLRFPHIADEDWQELVSLFVPMRDDERPKVEEMLSAGLVRVYLSQYAELVENDLRDETFDHEEANYLRKLLVECAEQDRRTVRHTGGIPEEDDVERACAFVREEILDAFPAGIPELVVSPVVAEAWDSNIRTVQRSVRVTWIDGPAREEVLAFVRAPAGFATWSGRRFTTRGVALSAIRFNTMTGDDWTYDVTLYGPERSEETPIVNRLLAAPEVVRALALDEVTDELYDYETLEGREATWVRQAALEALRRLNR